MNEENGVTLEVLSKLAERMIQRYVRDLLTVDELVAQIKRGWQTRRYEETQNGQTLEAFARGLCSQRLYEACRQPGGHLRDLAFLRLSEYLEQIMGNPGGTTSYAVHEIRAEVLQQTLLEILQSLQRERGQLEQPMAFLGWARVILRHQLTRYWHQKPQTGLLSLENQDEPLLAGLIDERTPDPLATILQRERVAELHTAIVGLRNPNYREVLLKTYFNGLEVREVADQLKASVTDIYLWHHRALQALQKQAKAPTRRQKCS